MQFVAAPRSVPTPGSEGQRDYHGEPLESVDIPTLRHLETNLIEKVLHAIADADCLVTA
jgi:hypothetical protein